MKKFYDMEVEIGRVEKMTQFYDRELRWGELRK